MTIDELETADRCALLSVWTKLIGGAPPSSISLPLIRHILAFEIQSREQGGLSPDTKRALQRATRKGATVASAAKPKTGSRLIREWGGINHVVEVTADGFFYRDRTYRSLSEVARTITGARWSGPRFFGMTGRGGA